MSMGEIVISKLESPHREAYRQGYLDQSTKKVGDNPYPEQSDAHWDWYAGWIQAHTDRINLESE